eukprot:6939435-Pyramimonas_sp.AAC.1
MSGTIANQSCNRTPQVPALGGRSAEHYTCHARQRRLTHGNSEACTCDDSSANTNPPLEPLIHS